ncbi:LLM class flavin-dependent oxidoreductase [Nonomuraea jiangxiensis]|uniref:Flavin-dependent oxidoreductase, luciferase family (Includes alkanesulfonate monooxygenase SsuD and methylene tetrahydromethanopterin reductase) n=1 Tax=Nonomuraea jiangxiensis TaxID=633440 RepID=A0A1G9IED6_9ACTN|nr:LLM class flavin-dependent oxidoreductase [Nonomuraea jiangxiensis]SDL23591.1 Flavin-dependent oxidoreductase, luciferase family (includes alkanesulfonate monooxygenase SsuD and methylene tetrahydromethanopterin reductase) [Nonomuraea jiangxiensis]
MDIGIGLPGHARWTDGTTLVDWARRAELRGFSSLSVSDRLAWSTPEPLITLAAAAGATSRIRLVTSVLLAPLRANHALFAKAVTTLDQLAGPGRLQLGLAPGLRKDDFVLSDVDYGTRGKQFDQLLDRLAAATAPGDPVGPRPATPGGPALLFGGTSKATLRRIVSRGTGWIAGDATVQDVQDFAPQLRQAWTAAGRPGAPRLVASVMYALGPDAEAAISDAVGSYYAFAGDEYADYGISIAYTRPEQITAAIAAFDQIGCDELIFMGNDPDPAQVDLLAEVIGL